MKAEILTIGDELLIGQTVNTNAAWIGEHLTLSGVDVVRTVTVGDDEAAIRMALAHAYDEADLVITTGGLGPTHDDLTKVAVAAYFEKELRFHAAILEEIEKRFAGRGMKMPSGNQGQAMVPEGFEILPNPNGTAPGLWYQTEGRMLAVLPGVPHEMQALMTDEVLPRLRRHGGLRVIAQRTLHTAGIGESNLQEQIGDLSGRLNDHLRLAYLPGTGGVRLRLTALAEEQAHAQASLDDFERHLRGRIDRYVYGTDGETQESIVGRLLTERGLTLALAESCTGGLVAHQLTNVSGSSAYLVGAVVAYSNQAKIDLLEVEEEVLAQEGAVSEAVVLQMAQGARKLFGADVGLASTGIAGPTGGTPEKPVGTVWIAYADDLGARAVLLRLVKDRQRNKELTSHGALELLRRQLLRRERVDA